MTSALRKGLLTLIKIVLLFGIVTTIKIFL
jgi:hypothetical protein